MEIDHEFGVGMKDNIGLFPVIKFLLNLLSFFVVVLPLSFMALLVWLFWKPWGEWIGDNLIDPLLDWMDR